MPSRSAHLVARAPWWIWGLTTTYVAFALLPLVWGGGERPGEVAAISLLYTVKSVSEAAAFVWAGRRADLGPRLRQAIWLTATAFSLSALLYASDAVVALQWIAQPPQWPFNVATFLTYIVGLAGMLRMPMSPARSGGWTAFLLDLAASVMGTMAVMVVLVTVPQLRGAPPDVASLLITFVAAEVVVLVGMNTLILRGIARPSRRAFWLFVAMLMGNLVNLTVIQLAGLGGLMELLPHFASVMTSGLAIWAACAFRLDEMAVAPAAPGPRWFESFNPLPLGATAGVALLLLHAAFAGRTSSLTLLAVVMVVQSCVLIIRLLVTARENERLQRLEAERAQAVQLEKTEAVGRLAGGMAHWYNNLLTTVIGHADLGAMQVRAHTPVHDGFREIRHAADRAAALTDQLLSYSGRQFLVTRPIPIREFLAAATRHLEARWPGRLVLDIGVDGSVLVRGDAGHLESLLRELAANAIDAMPGGGPVHVRADAVDLEAPLPNPVLDPPHGRYLRLVVQDKGVGIPAESLPSVFDPFFTTKPLHAAAGLGLASVYGIVAAHRGGLTVQSAPGAGTTMTVYLPLDPQSASADDPTPFAPPPH